MSVLADAVVLWGLMLFASHNSGYPIPPDTHLPKIHLATPKDLKAKTDSLPGNDWAAFTNPITYEIVLKKDVKDKTDVDGICGLAHEMTHYLQFVNGLNPEISPRISEPPAYMVQAACYALLYKDEEAARWARVQAVKYILSDD